jgi:two-component system C4-dicarboxylate transport sensor histidine kinase DctB
VQPSPSTPSLRTPAGKLDSLAEAHSRFARAALLIYLGAAAVAVSLLITALLTDKSHDEDLTREHLLLETDVRAHSLGQHLGLLVDELRRLSLRSEVDLLDQDLSPEKSLLRISHEKSTFFNMGVSIISPKGVVLWSEPQDFLPGGTSFAAEPWFAEAQKSQSLQIVPVQPDKPDAVLYVLAPLTKNQEFVGALLGGVDLARGEPLAKDPVLPTANALSVLATQEGAVIYPPNPPAFSSEPVWKALFIRPEAEPFTETAPLSGASTVVAASPVPGTSLVLMSVASEAELFRGARSRLETRLALGLVLATSPLLLLVVLLKRSLALFRRSEEDAVRQDRLRLLGEAASSIAHEVKNALNGLSVGLDLIMRRDDRPEAAARRERIVSELRNEMQRLTDFTTELMTFSKGIEPRRTRLDLTEFLPKVTGLVRDAAVERGAEIDLAVPSSEVIVDADPTLLHAVISNLASNALDAVTGKGGPAAPRVEVHVGVRGHSAELRVRDNGPGVSASMRKRLFEPFQTEKPNGVGIGLALAKKIAIAHGGDLVLEDNAPPGGVWPATPGATFLLTLPLENA